MGKNNQNLGWRKALIESEKKPIRDRLNKLYDEGGASRRFKGILDALRALESDHSEVGSLRQYIYCVSGLVHVGRYGNSNKAVVNNFFEVAHAILMARGIDPYRSKLRFLYGELYQARSQAFRKLGENWSAAWEIAMANRYRPASDEALARQILGSAVRAIRQGDFAAACHQYILAEETGSLPFRAVVTARLGRCLIHRLRGEFDQCHTIISETRRLGQLNEREELDLTWNEICLNLQNSLDFAPMIKAVSYGGTHHRSHFFLEAHLWVRCTPEKDFVKRLSLVRTASRSRTLKAHKEGLLYQCARAFEDANDTDMPFEFRLRKVGEMLGRRSELELVDAELLVLGASLVWLFGNKAYEQASLVLREYQTLCLRMSGGNEKNLLPFLKGYVANPHLQLGWNHSPVGMSEVDNPQQAS